MRELLLVGAGGFLGAAARYGISVAMKPWTSAFPWNTLVINVIGCFLIGLLTPLVGQRPAWFVFVVPGILGGFTTFSAFGYETLKLAEAGRGVLAAVYVAASVGLGLLAVWGARYFGSFPK
jgi:fluoride exporter